MSTAATFVVLGRKLARVYSAPLKNGIDLNPEVRKMAWPLMNDPSWTGCVEYTHQNKNVPLIPCE